jgi:hypothetical protein
LRKNSNSRRRLAILRARLLRRASSFLLLLMGVFFSLGLADDAVAFLLGPTQFDHHEAVGRPVDHHGR